jgi:hypothetical protein
MKRLLLTFSAVLFTASVFAGNLLVKEYGVNGTYSTIQDAINAAQDGDTIIVFNKPSGQYWLEDLVISKEVFLENSDANQRFNQLDGDIRIDPQDGKKMFFLGIDLMSGHKIYSNGGASDPANRCEINIMDCSMGEAEFADNNLHMRILDSDITTVSFRYGIMAGCTGDNLTISKGDAASATDSLVIVGNTNYSGIIDTYCSLRILNNRFYKSGDITPDPSNYYQCNSTGYNHTYYEVALVINDVNSGSEYKNIIANNTFWISGNHNTRTYSYCNYNKTNNTYNYVTALEVRYRDNFYIYNNIVDGEGDASMQKSFENNGGSGTPFVSHNYIESGVNNISIPTNNEFNAQGVSLTTDGNGKASGTPVDGGIYLGQYNDIDLTRNDAGTYGGPYSIDNYHGIMANPSGGKASVHFIEIPHFLTQPGTIELKGGSHTKE